MILALIEIIERGGIILILLALLSVLAWYILFHRYFSIISIEKEALHLEKHPGHEKRKIILEKEYSKNLFRRITAHRLSQNISIVETVYSLAPLLGLLGTVAGMIKTFTIIKIFGNGNPALMAEGISEALITTQAGLITAFPLMLFYGYLKKRINRLNIRLMKLEMGRI